MQLREFGFRDGVLRISAKIRRFDPSHIASGEGKGHVAKKEKSFLNQAKEQTT